jgi:hypothetical protein
MPATYTRGKKSFNKGCRYKVLQSNDSMPDVTAHSEHGLLIRCDIWSRSIEISLNWDVDQSPPF